MLNSAVAKSNKESAGREVAATFGRHELRHDPEWEVGFAAYLRESHRREELLSLFAQFRAGESAF